jgi:subtilase family serine protease
MGLNAKGEVLAPGTSFAAPVVTGVLAQAEQVADLSPSKISDS